MVNIINIQKIEMKTTLRFHFSSQKAVIETKEHPNGVGLRKLTVSKNVQLLQEPMWESSIHRVQG